MLEEEILNQANKVLNLLHGMLAKSAPSSYDYHNQVVDVIMGLQSDLSLLRDLAQMPSSVDVLAQHHEARQRLRSHIDRAKRLWPRLQREFPPIGEFPSIDIVKVPTLPSSDAARSLKLFYSYADKDEVLLQQLDNHLSGLKIDGVITEWNRSKIPVGIDQQNETDKQLQSANIILLLLSADFFASDPQYTEMKRALDRQKKDCLVIPILLRPVALPDLISGLKVFPRNNKPITSWLNSDEAFKDVAEGIRQAVDVLTSKQVTDPSTSPTTTSPFHGTENAQLTLNSTPEPRQCDVLLVTAKQEETQSIISAFEQETGRSFTREFLGEGVYYNLPTIGEIHPFLVQSEMGTGGPGGATLTIQEGIQILSPSAVLLVGVAFGVQKKGQRMGDILVSRQLMGYELQRVSQNKEGDWIIQPRGDRTQASTQLLAWVRSGLVDWTGPTVHIGLLLSGEKLVDNIDFRGLLQQLEPEAIGGEMEGAGLYAAAQRKRVDWVIIKAVCDWADGKKGYQKNRRQRIAAENAAKLVVHLLKLRELSSSPAI